MRNIGRYSDVSTPIICLSQNFKAKSASLIRIRPAGLLGSSGAPPHLRELLLSSDLGGILHFPADPYVAEVARFIE